MDQDYDLDVSPLEDPIFGMGSSQLKRIEADLKSAVVGRRQEERDLYLAAQQAALDSAQEQRQTA